METIRKWLKKKIELSEREIEKLQTQILVREELKWSAQMLNADRERLKEAWAKEEAYMECLKQIVKENEKNETSKDYSGFKL